MFRSICGEEINTYAPAGKHIQQHNSLKMLQLKITLCIKRAYGLH
jgi:hypothetical protein